MSDTNKIIVPVDFLQYTDNLVTFSTEIAGQLGAELFFLHVIEEADLYGGYIGPTIKYLTPEMTKQAETKMELLLSLLADTDIKCRGTVVSGDVVDSILECVKQESGDMIIIATHGRKGLEKFWLGSVAEKLIRSALCPVLSYTPPK